LRTKFTLNGIAQAGKHPAEIFVILSRITEEAYDFWKLG
jgi:hypothetical protein